ncbi:hypothetical protein [Chitinivorax tropicus]|nr:hypothetical protein [Chitinivorax tropicus]
MGDAPIASISVDDASTTQSGDEVIAQRQVEVFCHSEECQVMAGKLCWIAYPKRDSACNVSLGSRDLKKVEQLPLAQLGGNQDALLSAAV